MNIDALVENFYSKADANEDLINEVMKFLVQPLTEDKKGAAARDRVIRLPNLMATEITVGQKPGSEERKQFELWMGNIGMGGGEDASAVNQKLTAVTEFFANPAQHLTNATIPETLSYLMFLNQFVYMLKEFNASVAGFLWEPFLAALFGGRSEQVPTSRGDIADIRIYTPGHPDQPISLKILNEAGEVKGSFYDLIDHFAKGGTSMRYIIVVKDQSAIKKDVSAVTFYEFNITAESFFDWIGTVKHEEVATILPDLPFTMGKGGKGVLRKLGPETLEKGKNPPGNGDWFWIRAAHQEGHGKTIQTKWYRLGQLVTLEDGTQAARVGLGRNGTIRGSDPEGKTIKALNIQGISDALENGLLPLNAPLTADIGEFQKGGVGGATAKAKYQKQSGTAPGLLGIGGKDTKKLWGSIEQLSAWAALRSQLIAPPDKEGNLPAGSLGPKEGAKKLFTAIRDGDPELGLERAPGASGKGEGKAEEGSGTQFHISPKHYKGAGANLGTLKITEKEVVDFFRLAAENMNEELVVMFNKLADLNDNIGRFFLSSCGTGADGPAQCTPDDAANRTEAGQAAINDSKELEAAVVSSVSGMK
jgi:hypothetical protein